MKISKTSAVLFGILGLTAGTAGAIAFQTQAAGVSAAATTPAGFKHGTPPAAAGNVTAINGNTITLTGKNGTTYTINAGSAAVKKVSDSNFANANIAVGDTLQVNGSTSGTTITATNIVDGVIGFGKGSQPSTTTSPPGN